MSNAWSSYVRGTLTTFDRLVHSVSDHPVAVQQAYVQLEKCRERLERVYYHHCLQPKLYDSMFTELITNVCLQLWLARNLNTSII